MCVAAGRRRLGRGETRPGRTECVHLLSGPVMRAPPRRWRLLLQLYVIEVVHDGVRSRKTWSHIPRSRLKPVRDSGWRELKRLGGANPVMAMPTMDAEPDLSLVQQLIGSSLFDEFLALTYVTIRVS